MQNHSQYIETQNLVFADRLKTNYQNDHMTIPEVIGYMALGSAIGITASRYVESPRLESWARNHPDTAAKAAGWLIDNHDQLFLPTFVTPTRGKVIVSAAVIATQTRDGDCILYKLAEVLDPSRKEELDDTQIRVLYKKYGRWVSFKYLGMYAADISMIDTGRRAWSVRSSRIKK